MTPAIKPVEGEIELLRVQGAINAEPILAALRANGIPCRSRGEALGSVYGLTLDGLGEVAILVPCEFEAQARDLITAGEQHELEINESEVG
ncbi:MAG: putative signal transducing protein [Thermoanaerobaculales bacterium]